MVPQFQLITELRTFSCQGALRAVTHSRIRSASKTFHAGTPLTAIRKVGSAHKLIAYFVHPARARDGLLRCASLDNLLER
jgi:hypothetical protein